MSDWIISFRCPKDRIQLYMDLLMGEGLTVTVKPAAEHAPVRQADSEPRPKRYHRGKELLSEIVYNLLRDDQGTSYDLITKTIVGMGYAENSSSACLSRMKQAGLIERRSNGLFYRAKPFNKQAINNAYNKERENVPE